LSFYSPKTIENLFLEYKYDVLKNKNDHAFENIIKYRSIKNKKFFIKVLVLGLFVNNVDY